MTMAHPDIEPVALDAPDYHHPPHQPGWHTAPTYRLRLGDFALESGEVIRDCRQSFAVHGTLNAARDNAVLTLSAIGANHHRLDFLIGPGLAFDPARHCIIAVDALGNGLSTSPSNSALQPYESFPRFSIRDMVEAQRRLVQDVLGIERLAVVAGASMGGMQALQWAVSNPEAMDAVVAMTPMARTTPWSVAINCTARAAIMADPRWAEPGYLSRGMVGWVSCQQLISGRTPDSLAEEFADDASVRDWVERRMAWQAQQRLAPIDWVWQSHAYDAHDVGRTPGFDGDTRRALASVRARTAVLAPPLDLYNPAEAAREAAAAIPGARFLEIPSNRGHQAAGPNRAADAQWINQRLRSFLKAAGQPWVSGSG